MFELSVSSHFSGAHHLEGYEGSCSGHHGHNWAVEVFVRGDELNQIGIVVDYKVLKRKLKEIMGTLDHKDLNTISQFDGMNPSSENIARYIHASMGKDLEGLPCKVSRVRVHETPTSSATYSE